MSNAVLARLAGERQEQVDFIDQLLGRVEQEERDLVDAEQGNLKAARERIAALDEQIRPLADFESQRNAHADVVASLPIGRRSSEPVKVGSDRNAPAYGSAGSFMVDLL